MIWKYTQCCSWTSIHVHFEDSTFQNLMCANHTTKCNELIQVCKHDELLFWSWWAFVLSWTFYLLSWKTFPSDMIIEVKFANSTVAWVTTIEAPTSMGQHIGFNICKAAVGQVKQCSSKWTVMHLKPKDLLDPLKFRGTTFQVLQSNFPDFMMFFLVQMYAILSNFSPDLHTISGF